MKPSEATAVQIETLSKQATRLLQSHTIVAEFQLLLNQIDELRNMHQSQQSTEQAEERKAKRIRRK